MILLTKGTTVKFYVTLSDKQTLTNPNYLFYFRNRMTKEVVAFVQPYNSDISSYKYRVSRFDLVVNTYFTGATEGIWDFSIYEQASGTNVDPTGLNELKGGSIYLNPATTLFNPVKYTGQDNKYKVYNG
jgi:hypothetical protein